MTIKEMRKQLDNHSISAVELTKLYLDRITDKDKNIGAFLYVNPKAIESAKKAQQKIDAGESEFFTGIPVGLKDNLCTTDMPTTCASKMLKDFMSPYDAFVVSKLRSQDAVLIGKLNMDEFAMGATTQTSYYKKTKNPYDLERAPGGSSGGSASAVAMEFCAAALGSDTGGSIRQPASFCGVTGHRPTYGAVSRSGCVAFASSLDQVGPIAKNANDCAALLQAVCGADPLDQTSFNASKLLPQIEFSLKGKRIALIKELMSETVDSETLEAVQNAAEWFENAGALVEVVSLKMLAHGVPAYYLISSAEASANLSRFDGIRYGHRADVSSLKSIAFDTLIEKSRAEGFGWEVKRRILLGSYALCSGYYDDYYIKAIKLASELRREYENAFEKFDALISPVSPMNAFKFDEIPSDPAQLYLADVCTVGAPLAGLPSLSTPCGYTKDGLPIGLMITGKRWHDFYILKMAEAFEQEFKRRSPDILTCRKEGER